MSKNNFSFSLLKKSGSARLGKIHTKRGEIAISKYVNLAKKYNIAPSTFANAFVNDRPFVTSNIIGATSMRQLKENIEHKDGLKVWMAEK